MKENRIFSQRYAVVTTHFFHFKWLIAKFLNGHLTSASALIDRYNMEIWCLLERLGKSNMKENRIFSQRYVIVTTHFFHFKWLIAKFLNFRISFQIVRDDDPCHPMILKALKDNI